MNEITTTLPLPAKKRRILAIDPGCKLSAFVWLENPSKKILYANKISNEELRSDILCTGKDEISETVLAIEMIACYGMPVGREVFETCVWIGRFIEAWGGDWEYVYRRDVKMHLCNSVRAKDSNVRQALIDRFSPDGGGKTPQIGTKKQPGPLYGFAADMWAALGVAITYAETIRKVE